MDDVIARREFDEGVDRDAARGGQAFRPALVAAEDFALLQDGDLEGGYGESRGDRADADLRVLVGQQGVDAVRLHRVGREYPGAVADFGHAGELFAEVADIAEERSGGLGAHHEPGRGALVLERPGAHHARRGRALDRIGQEACFRRRHRVLAKCLTVESGIFLAVGFFLRLQALAIGKHQDAVRL